MHQSLIACSSCATLCALVALSGAAQGATECNLFEFDASRIDAGVALAPADIKSSPTLAQTTATPPAVHSKFGAEGSWRWQLLGGYANDLDGASQIEFGGSLSWFFVNDLSIDFQVEGDWIGQSGGNVWGGGATLLFRWHFINTDTWSLYGDAGCGVIGTTAPAPSNGTSFNFTPQVGGGVSFAIADDVRLMIGARWYHISNANTGESNPGRNSLMGYVMLSFPF